ncbi:unnamed protein product, partial [Hapterophycus canaliculatus]
SDAQLRHILNVETVLLLVQELNTVRQADTLAGNYGGTVRRASRGLSSTHTVSSSSCRGQRPLELLEQRLRRVEQELADTKAQVKDLRMIVDGGRSGTAS